MHFNQNSAKQNEKGRKNRRMEKKFTREILAHNGCKKNKEPKKNNEKKQASKQTSKNTGLKTALPAHKYDHQTNSHTHTHVFSEQRCR